MLLSNPIAPTEKFLFIYFLKSLSFPWDFSRVFPEQELLKRTFSFKRNLWTACAVMAGKDCLGREACLALTSVWELNFQDGGENWQFSNVFGFEAIGTSSSWAELKRIFSATVEVKITLSSSCFLYFLLADPRDHCQSLEWWNIWKINYNVIAPSLQQKTTSTNPLLSSPLLFYLLLLACSSDEISHLIRNWCVGREIITAWFIYSKETFSANAALENILYWEAATAFWVKRDSLLFSPIFPQRDTGVNNF